MELNSDLLRNVLDYVMTNNRVKKSIDARDNDKALIIEGIRTRVYKKNNDRDKAIVHVLFDYCRTHPELPDREDVVVIVEWDKQKGLRILKIMAVKEV